jgi:short-subunit dehydrogenase
MTRAKDVAFAHWMMPEDVVRISLRDLRNKNRVICVPGAGNKAMYVMAKLVPERLWYRLVPSIVKRMP